MNAKHTLFGILNVLLFTTITAASPSELSGTTNDMPQDLVDISGLYPQARDTLQAHFMAQDLRLIRGTTTTSLAAARYTESGPTVAVVIAEDQNYFYAYLETCDICAVLARASKNIPHVETLKQAHALTCADLKQILSTYQIQTSICDATDR